MTSCTHLAGTTVCGDEAVGRYLTGPRCAAHTPAALAGQPEAAPDPARTLNGLREAAGLPLAPVLIATSGLNDERAIASGRRRSSAHTYQAARAAEDARKAAHR